LEKERLVSPRHVPLFAIELAVYMAPGLQGANEKTRIEEAVYASILVGHHPRRVAVFFNLESQQEAIKASEAARIRRASKGLRDDLRGQGHDADWWHDLTREIINKALFRNGNS